MTYVTTAGDMWDLIAWKVLGSSNYVETLINANRNYIDTFIFPAGVELTVPEIEEEQKISALPPWKRS